MERLLAPRQRSGTQPSWEGTELIPLSGHRFGFGTALNQGLTLAWAKGSFLSLQFLCCTLCLSHSPSVFLHFCYMKYVFPSPVPFQNHLGALPCDQGRKLSQLRVWNPPSLALTISPNHKNHLNADAPCRKQACCETFMRFRKTENTFYSMYCVCRNRLWTVP